MATTSKISIKALHIQGKPEIHFMCQNITMVNQFSPSWNVEQAYGKMDGIPYYSNTSRQMQVYFESMVDTDFAGGGFTAAQLANSISTLMKFQYPRYTSGDTVSHVIQSPPFFEISHVEQFSDGNYSIYQPVQGYISGDIQIAPGHAAGIVPDFSGGLTKFGVGADAGESTTVRVDQPQSNTNAILENHYKVTFNFVVLHQEVPGWRDDKFSGRGIFTFDQGNLGDKAYKPNPKDSEDLVKS